MMKRWPFKRKPPPLHRALSRTDDEDDEGGDEKDSMLNVEELATRRRVRKKDSMKRNALHIAVRVYLLSHLVQN